MLRYPETLRPNLARVARAFTGVTARAEQSGSAAEQRTGRRFHLMPFLVLLIVALAAGVSVGLVTWRYPRTSPFARSPALAAAAKVGETARGHAGLRSMLGRRLDPESATGLALSLALLFVAVAGTVLGLLAFLVRTNARLNGIDRSVAEWGHRNASSPSTHALNGVTQLGSIYVVIGLCVVLALVELRRTGGTWIVPFIVIVVAGEEAASTVIKEIVDRARPAFHPAALALGPSFPSGHTTTAAAFYAAAALLLGRRRPRAARAVITGGAVAIAVAVAASRVFLDVHWLSDVIGGLALGWAWFVLCGIAFGGRLLRFGAGAEVAEAVVSTPSPRAEAGLSSRARPVSSGAPRS
jgi:membrane-associated phospholipid phosphatase